MAIKVKVPNYGWVSENLADWGSGKIEMSKVLDASVDVPVSLGGQKAIAHIDLECAPWPEAGSKKLGVGYVSIRRVEIGVLNEDGEEDGPPQYSGNPGDFELVE